MMYGMMSWAHGKITVRQFIQLLTVSTFANLAGCLATDYFLGYLTRLFSNPPYLSQAIANGTGHFPGDWGQVLLKGVGANSLVVLGVYLGTCSRSALGKLVGTWIPVWVFVTIGYEHVIANMGYIPMSMLYGSNIRTLDYIANSLVPSYIGNVIGGGVIVGLPLVYLYAWETRTHKNPIDWLRYNFVPDHSLKQELQDFWHQLLSPLPVAQES
jgi:formate/nitrite transporter